MLYRPMIGVVNVQAAIIGENKKLTLDVPNFCIRKRTIKTKADKPSRIAATIVHLENFVSKYIRSYKWLIS